MAWTTTRPEESGEIDSTTQTTTTTTTSMTMPETATVEMATTPPPPPMMRSPPKLERRTAGGGHHRRRSYHEWDTPPANCRDVGSDGFRPSDLANLLECMQPPDLGLADSCGNYDCGGGTGGRYKFDWNDDASAAERVREHRPPLSCAGDWSDRSLPSTPGSLQSNVVIEEEATMFVDGHEVTNTGVEHEVMNTVDEHEVTITVVLDEPTVAAVVLDEPTVGAVVLDEPTVAAVVQDEPTVTAVVQESDTSNASDPSLPSRRRTGKCYHYKFIKLRRVRHCWVVTHHFFRTTKRGFFLTVAFLWLKFRLK